MKRFTFLKSLVMLFALCLLGTGAAWAQTEVFYESFDKCNGTGGNDNQWSNNIATNKLTNDFLDNEGWENSNVDGLYWYIADQCIKVNSSSTSTNITTPAIVISGKGTLTFRAGAWKKDNVTLNVEFEGATASDNTSFQLTQSQFDDYTIHFEATSSPIKITFSGKKRFFLDEVKVVAGEEQGGGDTPEPPVDEEETFFEESFGADQGLFTIDNKNLGGTTYVWSFDENYGMKASAFVSGTRYATESWLVSPSINLADATTATLTFEQAANFFNGTLADAVSVQVREQGGEWTELDVTGWPAGNNWTFVTSTADLSAYVGKTIQIAFAYTSTTSTAGTWEIKNFIVKGKGEGGVTEVAAPEFSVPAGMYSKPFDLTLSAPEADLIMYTLDGSDPSFENNVGEIYEEGTPIHISETTTVKAIALDADANASRVVSATYTIATLVGDGSFENPYTIADLKLLGNKFKADDVWVKGTIVGVYQSGGLENPIKTCTNIALGTDDKNYIPVQLPSGSIRNALNIPGDPEEGTPANPEMLNQEVTLHGNLETYFNVLGLKDTDKAAGLGEIEVSATGYSTYFTDMPFEVPAGIEAGIVTGAENGKLTVDYRYTEGDRVPANTGLLVKAAEGTYPIVVINSSAQTPDNNYLKGSVETGMTEGDGCLFYMLSYDKNGKNLGFYWGAEDGAAFESGAGKAYLALPQTVASQVRGFILDGSTTGISGVTAEATNAPAAVYSLTGVRMGTTTDNLPAGIYIVNGKKVLVK